MRTSPPIYKYAGTIAGFGLASLLIGFVLLLAVESLRLASWIILALGVLLLITAAIIDFRRVRGAVTGRRGRFSTGNTVMVFVFIGIIVLVNAISFQYNKRYDITELAQFTLTSQTKDVLAEMTMPVEAICFFTPQDILGLGLPTYAQNLLSEYQNYTDLLTVTVIDPDEQPDEARKYGISEYQSIVFESETGRRIVSPEDMLITSGGQLAGIEMENPFTSAILEVTGVVQKKVYFLSGHGEESVGTTGQYAYAAQALKDILYKVETLDLMAAGEVPADCTVLVIAAPQNPLSVPEYNIIRDYLDNKGRVIILINPGTIDDMKEFISEYWMNIEEGTVIDESAYYSTPNIPIIPRTQNSFGSLFGIAETYYPGAVAITPAEEPPDDILMAPLLQTSIASWVEADYDPTVEPVFNKETETLGSRWLGVWVAIKPPEEELNEDGTLPEGAKFTQIIVMGDSDFASNQHFYNADNRYQFLYMFEYMTAGEVLVKIERKVLPYRSLIITPEEETFIRVSSIGLLPLLVLVAGTVIWWRRR
jgi:ABC-2 type transport system permease protein